MPWNKHDFPDSMKNLPGDVRNKAIEIANALLEEGYDEGRSIAIGIDRARSALDKDEEKRPHYEVVAEKDRWVLRKKNGSRSLATGETKKELLEEAKEYVKKHDGVLTIYKEDGETDQTLYN